MEAKTQIDQDCQQSKECMETVIFLIFLILGLAYLFRGRKLFWIYVGISGLLLGAVLGLFFARDSGLIAQIVLAVVNGVLVAVLAIYLQKPMAVLSAFISGGVLVTIFFVALTDSYSSIPVLLLGGRIPTEWGIVFLVSGTLLAVATWLLFDWTLIVLTSLMGAQTTLSALASLMNFSLPPLFFIVLVLCLAGLGIWVQASMLPQRLQSSAAIQPGFSQGRRVLPPPLPGKGRAFVADRCPQCNAPLRSGARFCSSCGNAV